MGETLKIFGSFGMEGREGIVTIESLEGHCQLGDSDKHIYQEYKYIYPESCYKKDWSVLFLLF